MSVRLASRSAARWVFGLAVTVFFLAIWGRAVVADAPQLAESLSPLATSQLVTDSVADWVEEEAEDYGIDSTLVAPTIDDLLASSEVDDVMEELVGEVIVAASLPGTAASSVDVAEILSPSVPEVSAALGDAGIPVSEAQVAAVVRGLDPIEVRPEGSQPIVGEDSSTVARLGTAAALALIVAAAAGAYALLAAEDRLAELRSLLTRVAVGGLTFAVLLRLGSWVLDPDGGRAPVAESLSSLAESKWMVPILIAGTAALLAASIWASRLLLRPEAEFQTSDEPPTEELELQLSSPK